ncbi:uncharacterized protein PITG_00379 [Phytophthora infestans T30-4]|uniref:Uncharacterized protein n=1 Tax=Phytophthora infestans (strain T30-4) TaxID=403677 RepID=D0MQM8_PHYIT|nr:uncharacterized protein PITG_00379 [Phytophthora infestans T30-4]EEY57797.1 hypothetical protein PITG_00379 [Phytophthora infestans T30-4]|eukprot:XP_002908983.1 hypothetical protein PITG_00379 [Phytophthora infestans T30-4]
MLLDRNLNLVGIGEKCFRVAASNRDPEMANNAMSDVQWEVSYARQGALDLTATPGAAVFWPVLFTRDILALEYTRREQPQDKMFSVVWMALTPRKGICMKLLATQTGHLKTLQDCNMIKSGKPKASKATRKMRKPHFPGQQLNKIAVDITN